MKIYILGPMSGLHGFNRSAFNEAQRKLVELGHVVLNPAVLPDGLEERDYMAITLPMLMASEAVYALNGWEMSKGASAEHALAIKLGMGIINQDVPHDPSTDEIRRYAIGGRAEYEKGAGLVSLDKPKKSPGERIEGSAWKLDMGPLGSLGLCSIRAEHVCVFGDVTIEVMNSDIYQAGSDTPALEALKGFVEEWKSVETPHRGKMRIPHQQRVLFNAFMSFMRAKKITVITSDLAVSGTLNVKIGLINYQIKGLFG